MGDARRRCRARARRRVRCAAARDQRRARDAGRRGLGRVPGDRALPQRVRRRRGRGAGAPGRADLGPDPGPAGAVRARDLPGRRDGARREPASAKPGAAARGLRADRRARPGQGRCSGPSSFLFQSVEQISQTLQGQTAGRPAGGRERRAGRARDRGRAGRLRGPAEGRRRAGRPGCPERVPEQPDPARARVRHHEPAPAGRHRVRQPRRLRPVARRPGRRRSASPTSSRTATPR